MSMASHIKHFLILTGVAAAISLVSISSLRAQTGGGSSTGYLAQIAANTSGILQQVNNLSNYLQGLGAFIVSWMTNDTSSTTQQMQSSFANIGNLIVQDATTQATLQTQFTATQFSPLAPAAALTPASLSAPATSPTSILKTVPYINDLTYATLLGMPPAPKASNLGQSPYNFIANASGITLGHTIPGLNWQGPSTDQARYQNYFNTIMAVESFNAYVLSNQYVESQNKNALTTAQNALVSQASNSTWIAQIATQELGKVLRQILMFQSQTYVLLTQLVQAQKQLVAAQVMTNSLLIAGFQISESLLVNRAQGVTPQG